MLILFCPILEFRIPRIASVPATALNIVSKYLSPYFNSEELPKPIFIGGTFLLKWH